MKLTFELRPGVDLVGVVDHNLRDFHGFDTSLGSSYNAYLIRDEKVALIDTAHPDFVDQFQRNVTSLVELDKIDYLVCLHAELDHSGALPEMVKACPNATVVCNAKCKEVLASLFDVEGWKFQIFENGETLSLGKRSLTFMNVPMVHWPESSVAFMPEEKILFSSDAFGQHLATSNRFDDECYLPLILAEAKIYYANIVTPYGRQVLKVLKSVDELQPEMIAPAHGVIWRSHVKEILEAYPDWASGKYAPKVLVIYDSMWHSTELMAEEIYAGAVEYGKRLAAENPNEPALEVHLLHARKTTLTRIAHEALDAAAVAFGSATLHAFVMPQMEAVLGYFQGLKFREKTALSFGSHGWGRGAPEIIQETLAALKYPALDASPIVARQRPNAAALESCRNAGAELAKAAWERYLADK
ncbi:MAG: FprA family A-type flavoprotein [Thermoguttaceae bacterium]|jgi:anaerobic nitric oxide reductase flavorubredoxin